MRAHKGIVSFAVVMLAWTLATPEADSAQAGYFDVAVDVIQVKLNDEAVGGVDEDEVLGFGESFRKRLAGLATKGKTAVLGRFRTGLTTEEPAEMEALRKVIIVSPVSFEDKEYERFLIEEVGTSVRVSALQVGDGKQCAVSLDAKAGNVIGWMKDGNPVILESVISGTRLMEPGQSLVFSTLVAGDDREMDRDPVRDFTTEATEDALTRPSCYQFMIVVTLK